MRLITVEEHFVTPGFLTGPGREISEALVKRPGGKEIFEQLQTLGEKRIAEMDAAGIDVQVLSLHCPGVEQSAVELQPTLSREANDFLAEVVSSNPKRFAGFAVLPTANPEAAARELDLRVLQQGFKGAVINGHTQGRYLDDVFFSPILGRAESLGVPIYLHPTFPPRSVVEALYGGFSSSVSAVFAGPGWGWHIETATHLLRMILGGVFDRHPNLQIIIGHLGEAIPFMLPRLAISFPAELTQLAHPIEFYLRNNVYYTFGGFNFPATFMNLFLEIGIERILFSVDYPYASMSESRKFLEQLPLRSDDRERIGYGNAEQLLKL